MKVNGDAIIELLGLLEWNNKIQNILHQFGQEQVSIPSDMYSTAIYIKEYGLSLDFTYIPATKLQYEKLDINDFYYNQVSFEKNYVVALPFGLQKGDTYDICVEKVQKATQVLKLFKASDFMVRVLFEKNDIQYFCIIGFIEDRERGLEGIVIYPVNIKENYSALDTYEMFIGGN